MVKYYCFIGIFHLLILAVWSKLLKRVRGSRWNLSFPEEAVVPEAILVHGDLAQKQLRLVNPDASIEPLAATEADVQYHGITVDAYTGDVYFATSNSAICRIRKRSTNSSTGTWQTTTVIGGWVSVHVGGYNLGASHEDVLYFSVRGVECSNMRRESSNSLVCVSGDPVITTDLGKDIGTADIVVQTAIGGWTEGGYPGDFVDTELSDHSLKPIITRVEVISRSINPRAVYFEAASRHLYYSDIDTRSIERITILDDTAIVDYDTFLPNVGRVHGIAIDANEGSHGGFLYFSDAQRGTVSRIELATEGQPTTAIQVLVSGVMDPMGVALEPNEGRLFFTLGGGSIRAVGRDGSAVASVRQNVSPGSYEVRRFDSGTRLDGIAISLSDGAGDDTTERRLYWSESGHSPALKRSSLDGTRVETIPVMDSAGHNIRMVWPRGITFGSGASAGLLFYERLGSIRRLPDPAGGESEPLIEEDVYPTAVEIQTLITRAEKEGGKSSSNYIFKSAS